MQNTYTKDYLKNELVNTKFWIDWNLSLFNLSNIMRLISLFGGKNYTQNVPLNLKAVYLKNDTFNKTELNPFDIEITWQPSNDVLILGTERQSIDSSREWFEQSELVELKLVDSKLMKNDVVIIDDINNFIIEL